MLYDFFVYFCGPGDPQLAYADPQNLYDYIVHVMDVHCII